LYTNLQVKTLYLHIFCSLILNIHALFEEYTYALFEKNKFIKF
jgi:hypothetical protein